MKLKQVAAVLILLFIGLLLAAGWSGERGLHQVRYLMKQYYQLVNRTKNMQTKNVTLQKEVKQLKDDKFWLEKQVREQLGWVKPGEVVYKFKTLDNGGNTQ